MRIYVEAPKAETLSSGKNMEWSASDYESQRDSYDQRRFLNKEEYWNVGREQFENKILLGEKIRDYLDENRIDDNVFCVGVGDAYVEIQFAGENRKLFLTDYDAKTIREYKKLFEGNEKIRFESFDLLKDEFGEIPKTHPIIVANAILYVFNDKELSGIIERIREAGFSELIIVSHTHVHAKNKLKRTLKLILKYVRLYLKRLKKNTKFYGYYRETNAYKKILAECGLKIQDSLEIKVNVVRFCIELN